MRPRVTKGSTRHENYIGELSISTLHPTGDNQFEDQEPNPSWVPVVALWLLAMVDPLLLDQPLSLAASLGPSAFPAIEITFLSDKVVGAQDNGYTAKGLDVRPLQ